MRSIAAITLSLTLFAPLASADRLGFTGDKLVEPNCSSMSSWYNCRSITSAPANVRRGAEYMHNSSRTLGPFGNTKYPDGSPYATTVTACTSCHFTGGTVPFGTPFYQSPDKYAGLPYFRPLNYRRDLEDSIIDCFRNCMNAERSPTKDDPVMRDLVAYIEWVADGVIDPEMQGAGWVNLPGKDLPAIDGILTSTTLKADPARGRTQYRDRCAGCHDKDGPGAGEYRRGEGRPRTPALWGLRDGHSRAAAFYRNSVLAAYIQKHMPYGKPNTLSVQTALDIAAYINQQARPSGMADQMFCHVESDGIPGALRKPADWLIGCFYPGEPFTAEQIRNGPWGPITAWRNAEIARLKGL